MKKIIMIAAVTLSFVLSGQSQTSVTQINSTQTQTVSPTPTQTTSPTATTPVITPALYPDDLPQLENRETFKAWASEHVSKVVASIGASLPTGDEAYKYVPVSEASANGMIETAKAISLSVDIVNPKDSLYAFFGAYDNDGYPLFTGNKQFYPVLSASGVCSLPPDYKDVEFELCEDIWIFINGAQTAFVDVLGPDGRTMAEYPLEVSNGRVRFSQKLFGEKVILAVYTGERGGPTATNPNGGTPTNSPNRGWLYWDIANKGKAITPSTFAMKFNPTIKGMNLFSDVDVNVCVPTSGGVGTNVTAELKITTGWTKFPVSFWTSEGKWFKSAWVRKSGEDNWQMYTPLWNPNLGKMAFYLPVQTGIYYVIPVWNDGDLVLPPDPWVPPYDYSNGQG